MWLPRPLRHWLHDRKIRALARRYQQKLKVIDGLTVDQESKEAAREKVRIAAEKKLEEYAG